MLEIKILIEKVDYPELIKKVVPLFVKNKLMANAAILAANTKLRSMSESEQEQYVAHLISGNKEKITELLNTAVKNKGISGNIKDLNINAV